MSGYARFCCTYRIYVAALFGSVAFVVVPGAKVLGGPVSFTTFTTANGLGSNSVRSVSPLSAFILHAATANGVSKAMYDGTAWGNWTNTTSGLASVNVRDVQISGNFHRAATNGGVSWGITYGNASAPSFSSNSTTANGLGSNDVRSVHGVYAATAGGVSVSTGSPPTSWTNYTTSHGLGSNDVRGVFAAGNTAYAATAGGLSIATGSPSTSWTNYTTANGLGSNDVRSVFALSGTIYAATGAGVSLSTNGGANWTNYTSANGLGSNDVRSVFALSGTIYAATGGGVSLSTNGGVNWTNYTTANGLGSNDVNDVVADASFIYVATNGGLSIAPVAVPEPSTYAMALAGLACGGYSIVRRRKRA